MKRISTLSKPVTDFSELGLQEYLLVANPSEEVAEKVMREKAYFYDEYRERIAIKTKPHITVANFLAAKEMEELIIRQLQRICGTTNSFTVTLNNFSGFPPSSTIYLCVHDAQPFKQLAKRIMLIDQYIAANNCPPLKVVDKPHMTIARSISESSYLKAIDEYSRKKFRASFTVAELVLIKRNHQLNKCKIVSTIKFLPLVNTLFN